ncbi:MAG: tetrahydromethanopterin S-methyltransferase subunit A [Thermoproteota archaeon]|nr:tetrahydromethanopterin S-methyltransferase subunit A [Thermoproteota archaeon]
MRLTIKKLEDGAGQLCKALLPIKHEYCLGSGKVAAICTLSSFDLLEIVCRSSLMDKVLIAGRLLSENKGIDAIIGFTINHPELNRILLCGKEVKGHRAGQALLALARNGVSTSGRIIGADGPNPIITRCAQDVDIFRRQVRVIDSIGTVDIDRITQLLVS